MNGIRTLRKDLDLTQAEFAKKLNISRSNLAAIETERVALTERTINDICREFKVNKEWLINGTGEMYQSCDTPEELEKFLTTLLIGEDDIMKETILTLSTLSPEEFKIVSTMINSLKK